MLRTRLPSPIPRRAAPRPATALHRCAGHRPARVRRPGALPRCPADLSRTRASPPSSPDHRPPPAFVRNPHGRGFPPPPVYLSETRASPPAGPGRCPTPAFVRTLRRRGFPPPPADLSKTRTPAPAPQHQAGHGQPRPFVRNPPSRNPQAAPGHLSECRLHLARQRRRPGPPIRPQPALSRVQPPPRHIRRNRPPSPTRSICPKQAVPGFPCAAPFRPPQAWG